jgi:hypothetical protein
MQGSSPGNGGAPDFEISGIGKELFHDAKRILYIKSALGNMIS